MEKNPTPDEQKPTRDPRSGEVEPAPSKIEGARVMANEADEELEEETSLDEQDVRQLAEDYVTKQGADDTENFTARVLQGGLRRDQAEDRATSAKSSSP
jgi:hypothetical protein